MRIYVRLYGLKEHQGDSLPDYRPVRFQLLILQLYPAEQIVMKRQKETIALKCWYTICSFINILQLTGLYEFP